MASNSNDPAEKLLLSTERARGIHFPQSSIKFRCSLIDLTGASAFGQSTHISNLRPPHRLEQCESYDPAIRDSPEFRKHNAEQRSFMIPPVSASTLYYPEWQQQIIEEGPYSVRTGIERVGCPIDTGTYHVNERILIAISEQDTNTFQIRVALIEHFRSGLRHCRHSAAKFDNYSEPQHNRRVWLAVWFTLRKLQDFVVTSHAHLPFAPRENEIIVICISDRRILEQLSSDYPADQQHGLTRSTEPQDDPEVYEKRTVDIIHATEEIRRFLIWRHSFVVKFCVSPIAQRTPSSCRIDFPQPKE